MGSDTTGAYPPTPDEAPKPKRDYNEVRIKYLKADTMKSLRNIASHIGVPVSNIVKKLIADYINAQPEHMRLEQKK